MGDITTTLTKVNNYGLQNYHPQHRTLPRSSLQTCQRQWHQQPSIQLRSIRRNKIFEKSQEIPIEPLDKCRYLWYNGSITNNTLQRKTL